MPPPPVLPVGQQLRCPAFPFLWRRVADRRYEEYLLFGKGREK